MSTIVGKNMKLNVARTHRAQTRAIYEGVLGCTVTSPGPDIEIFEFADGRNVGVFYGDPKDALTLEQHAQAIWLELEVDDLGKTESALLAAGARAYAFDDPEHHYFQAPGGQIFRLAQRRPS